MIDLFHRCAGDYEAVIDAYVAAEKAGLAPRRSQAIPAREYADRLWRDGIGKGWLPVSLTKRSSPKKGDPLVSRKAIVTDSDPNFDEHLRVLGQYWRCSDRRPTPRDDALRHWSALVRQWSLDASMPLLVRKGSLRNIRTIHSSGRTLVVCDNSPAQWAFKGCFLGDLPSLEDVRHQLEGGQVPIAFAPARNESAHVSAGLGAFFGGYISKSKYGNVNKFPDGNAYKLCHIEGIGIRTKGEAQTLDLPTLQQHMQIFLDPANMFVIPLRYAGVGECAAFISAFT